MSGLNAFLSQNAIQMENEKHVISDRFKDENGKTIPWEIRSMTESESSSIRKQFTKKIKNKNGTITTDTDIEGYIARVVVECIIHPNLKDAKLQESYGVMGAESLAKKMLKTGEYSKLVEIVQEVNGFDEDMNEIVDKAKN